ncbi:MAG: RNA polymerase sigma factor SigJ [Actinomycetota bacterium]|nr:RNA polymerase sigma factor SigJ [Actinomycetota bacterium]
MSEPVAESVGSFEVERPRLRALAYRMLGSMADADDVVQETWLRWNRLGVEGRAVVERPAAWLTTATSRLALDRLKSAQHQRELYVGPWLPEPVLTDDDPAVSVELAESLTLGFLAVLERLGPVERAVFLLADVFGEPFAAIAPVVGRSEEAFRQIASRARRRVREERHSFHPTAVNSDELVDAFMAACAFGDVDQLRRVLSDDVVLVSDGGREVHAARRPVLGFHRVSRLLTSLTKRLPADLDVERHEVNGEPGLVFSLNGVVWLVMVFEQHADRFVALRLVLNPEKLRHVGLNAAS